MTLQQNHGGGSDNNSTSVELADVFRKHGERYRACHTLTPEQHKVMNAVINCRTSVLGGHMAQCDNCDKIDISYNSCRNRHCPKCQALRTARWLENRRKELLPVQYFHMVFTLPHELNHLVLYNKELLYTVLFQATWEALDTLGQSPKQLNGKMGMIGLLHTWGQTMSVHNHLHCIVPGGALTGNGKWNKSKKDFLLPVKALSKIFKGISVSKLRALYTSKQLKFPDTCNDADFSLLLDKLMNKDWVVYSKKPFGGPQKLLDYLGRYTHKIAISNYRIIRCDDTSVTFTWRDYADDNKVKEMTLKPEEFIRRYLSHVVPKGFMRIRFYGFLANACKAKNIAAIREQLNYTPILDEAINQDKDKTVGQDTTDIKDIKTLMQELAGIDISICTACEIGHLKIIKDLPSKLKTRTCASAQTKFNSVLFDTS